MIKYLRYYFSAEGQRVCNVNWNYNSVIMHHRHEEEAHNANILFKEKQIQEEMDLSRLTNKIFEKLGIKRSAN